MIACNSESTSATAICVSTVITHQEEHYENIVGEMAPTCLPARFGISQVSDRITGKTTQDVVLKRFLIKMWYLRFTSVSSR